MGLSAIFQDGSASPRGEIHDGRHAMHLPVQVGDYDGLYRGPVQNGLETVQIHQMGVHLNVDIDRFGTQGLQGCRRIEPCIGHGGDPVAGLYAERPEGDFDRIRSIGHAEREAGSAISRELEFELLKFLTHHQPAALDDSANRLLQPRDRRNMSTKVVQGKRGHRSILKDGGDE